MNWQQVEQQFDLLPLREQMALIERFVQRMRAGAYPTIDPEEAARRFDDMANDPAVQRELRMLPLPGDAAPEAKESA